MDKAEKGCETKCFMRKRKANTARGRMEKKDEKTRQNNVGGFRKNDGWSSGSDCRKLFF